MPFDIERMRADIKRDRRKFTAQAVICLAASVGAGFALGTYVNTHSSLAGPPPIVFVLLPPTAPLVAAR